MKKLIALFITLALSGTAHAALKNPLGIGGEIAARSSTPAEESVLRVYDADNNAKAFYKKSINLHSNNGNAYRLFGDLTIITAGNDDGTLDSTEDKIRESTGSAIIMGKNCSNCDSLAQDVWLVDYKLGGSIGGHTVRFLSKYDATYGFGFRVDPGIVDPKRIDGFVVSNTNINLGKGNNGKYYGMRFNPATLSLEFFENIGTAGEVKVAAIPMILSPSSVVMPTVVIPAVQDEIPAGDQVNNGRSLSDEIKRRKGLR